MYVDLLTLYFLAIGTLLASAGMTFWEQRANPKRSKELRVLAAGFATLAIGCAAALFRRDLPGAIGSAISNLVILGGYLLILNGVAMLGGRQYRRTSAGILLGMALVWTIGGARWLDAMWSHVSSVPIAIISGLTAWEMLRCNAMKSLNARYIVVAVTGVHTALYAARAFVLPWLTTGPGQAIQSLAGKLTIYEGVLYSVILPMTLLKLIRDETHGQLLLDSQTDYLTRLGNRRWFFEQGARVIDGRERQGAVSVLAFDLDHFKSINDRYGHQTGDRVLKSFAEIARSVLGPDAILARIGGEEFAALLWGDDAIRAKALGEAVAQRFAETISNRTGSIGIPATVSIGLARFDSDVPAIMDGLAIADRALYRAKSLGGNRLEVAQAAPVAA
ncbi:sensor domain-containing diguanylate cyclase [Achromobacter deleyi]|uniref:GGDEF domain-containing protein n=1 Tax=Achromobacter deleyi TaxID=1353891 RepID=UPI0014928A0B|nr:GGDEF domain-containing protein [Achromobacter deleyi]QVQ29671.1 GGDEF domain-containing protein [Achromobacter deleyi]UIP18569.1 GGDEF domain-containing protein [Achromobacter deleyi]